MKTSSLAILIFVWSFYSVGSDTNEFYVTGSLAGLSPDQRDAMIKVARESRESLPAAAYPEGNWGQVRDGVQISLRFNTNKYTLGNPISAIVLIRNVTNTTVLYPASFALGEGPIRIAASDDQNRPVPANPNWGEITISAGQAQLDPRSQRKWTVQLDNLFDFKTNGIYTVYARLPRMKSDIESAKVKIELTGAETNKQITH